MRPALRGTKFGGGKAKAGKNSFPPTPFFFARPSGNYQKSVSGFSLKKVRILFRIDSRLAHSPRDRKTLKMPKKASLMLKLKRKEGTHHF